MRAFGALRGFPFFGRKSFRRQQQRQQGNKASQAGGQPLSDGSSTTVRSGQRASEESLLNIHVCVNLAENQICRWFSHMCKHCILPSFYMAMPGCTGHGVPHHPMPAINDVFALQSWLTHPVMKAAYTSGSLSLAGDLIAQLYSKRGNNVVCPLLNLHFCTDCWSYNSALA